ncbi:hypothetical protein B0H14DRAFT_3492324 [Mycena olivaceomarginata]|nr:hypothetical protein B0H14DRAFT_3492324 [Mycena olivaceomarginata]
MSDTERVEVMDFQRFDISKRTNRKNLSIQTGLSDEETTSSTRSSSPVVTTPEGTWGSSTFGSDSSPDLSDSASADSVRATHLCDTVEPPRTIKENDHTELFFHTDISFLTPRTLVRPIARCFSRPSSPVTSRPSSPLRPSSPINFGALNCFASADAFTEHVERMQAQRAREVDGLAEVKVNMHKVITTDVSDELPWIVQQVIDPQALRLRAEPRGVISSP